jgi:hypothetical protein
MIEPSSPAKRGMPISRSLWELALGQARADTPHCKEERQQSIQELLTALPIIRSRRI